MQLMQSIAPGEYDLILINLKLNICVAILIFQLKLVTVIYFSVDYFYR